MAAPVEEILVNAHHACWCGHNMKFLGCTRISKKYILVRSPMEILKLPLFLIDFNCWTHLANCLKRSAKI